MNPVALQQAKGGPFAPTPWGGFGPGILVSVSGVAGPTVETLVAEVSGVASLSAALTVVNETIALAGDLTGVASLSGALALTSQLSLNVEAVASLSAVFASQEVSTDFSGWGVPILTQV